MPFLLNGATAEQVRALIRKGERSGEPRPQRKTPTGRFRVLAKCTSTTAASGSGIGAECYPAVIVSTDPGELVADQPTYASVWLTVVQGGAAITPTDGAWYECELAGTFDPGSDPRVRTFCALEAGGSAGDVTASSTNGTNGGGDISSYAITADTTWENTGVQVTVPSTGDYLVMATACAGAKVSATVPSIIKIRLYDSTAGAALGATSGGEVNAVCTTAGAVNVSNEGATSLIFPASLTSGHIIKLQAGRAAATWTTSLIIGYGGGHTTRIHLLPIGGYGV